MGWLMTIIGVPLPKSKKKATKYKKKEGDKGKEEESLFGKAEGAAEIKLPSDEGYKIVCDSYSELDNYLHITSVNSESSTRLPTHPLENGMVKHDHKIVEPKKYTAIAYVKANNYSITKTNDYSRAMKCTKILDALIQSADLKDYIKVYSPMMEEGMAESDERKCLKLYLTSYRKGTENDKTDVFTYTLNLQEILFATSEANVSNDPDFAGNSNKGGQGQGSKG